MQATLWFYIIVGSLTILPLVIFNIPRVFVKKPPEPMKVNWARGVTIVLMSVLIAVFLVSAYNATMHERYEIALERAASEHGEFLVGDKSEVEFRAFLIENGTDSMKASVEQTPFGEAQSAKTVRFQLSSWCIPKYWQSVDGVEQVEVLGSENPVYVMYLLELDGQEPIYYAMRMVNTNDGWKYDWIGEANDTHKKIVKMPTLKNGKWYTVS